MTIATSEYSNHGLQSAVEEELNWTPDVDAAGIGVAVHDGAVTLSGEVATAAEHLAAREAALRVDRVSTVLDDITVRPQTAWPVTETQIAEEVRRALTWASDVPNSVKARVDGHHVILTGEVSWDFQRRAARRAAQFLRGVHSVDNQVTLSARPSATDMGERIKNALARIAQIDASHIRVAVAGNRATLTGSVRSWAEKEQAGLAAYRSPHVTEVDNRIVLRSS